MKITPAAVMLLMSVSSAPADTPGWVDQLVSKRGGVCCFDNDGRRLIDPDWDVQTEGYIVRFPEGWLPVPEEAIVRQTNQDGIARVWSVVNDGKREIRCFLPGALG